MRKLQKWHSVTAFIFGLSLFIISKNVTTTAEESTVSKAPAYFHFLVGSLASLDNNSATALENYQLAAKSDPGAKVLTLKQVEELLNLNRPSEARTLIDSVAKSESKNPDFFLLQARLASQESDLNLALKALDQASALFYERGNSSKAREMVLTKVAMLADNHEYAQSVASLEKFIKQEPEDEISFYFLGKIHTIFQNRALAKKAYKKAIELRPTFLAASKALGLQLELEGKLKEAVGVYQNALRGGANDEELLQKLVNLALINEDYTSAIEYLQQYLLVRPDDAQNQMRAGLIHYKLKNYSKAEEAFENLLTTQTNGQDRLLFYLGSIHQEQNHLDLATSYFEKVGSNSEYFVESQIQASNFLFFKASKTKEAIELMQSALEKKPESTELVLGLAGLLEQNDQTTEAIKVLQKASERSEDSEKISFMLGSLLDRSGDFEGSIKVMRKVLATNINNAHALNHIGYSYAERGINLDEAESLLKRAIQLAPKNGFIVDSLGWTYFKMGRYKKARELLVRADKLNPDQPVILEHLADTYRKLGNTRLALEVYKRIMRTSASNDASKTQVDPETKTVQDRVREKMALLSTSGPN